ncbi:MAG TPA: hypothetical protein PKA58_24740, partial [Polyangium sp.]|nr:hypothetical protein [Polyangium sp.]
MHAPGRIRLLLDGNCTMFSPTELQRLAERFECFLGAAIRNPDQCISQLPLMSEAEKQQVQEVSSGKTIVAKMSYFVGVFADFERPSNQPPVVKLSDAGFTLFPPTSFFQTLGGNPSFPDLNVCRQCDRAFVNQPGNNGCDAGYYCNDAALCAPCDSNQMCGPTCSPCGGNTPHCENVAGINQCVECRTDADCANGGTCDATTHVCNGSSSTSTGGNGGDGGNGNGGSGGNGQMPGESGCSCRTTSNGLSGGMPVMLGLFGVGWGLLRMRRRRQKR